MGRRPESNDNDVSLFPFLSILACIIGVLTLMISTLALSQMDNKTVAAAEEFERVAKEVTEKEAEMTELQTKIDEQNKQFESAASDKQRQIAELQKQVTAIQRDLLEAQKKRDAIKEMPGDEALQKQPLDELEAELKEHSDQIAQLTKEIEERKLPPEEAEFSVLPGGSGVGIKPFFIECTKNDIVLHQPDSQIRVRNNQFAGNADLLKFFDKVAGTEDGKVIFLIRDDAVHTWWRAKTRADELDVPHGKLPVMGHGRLNLDRVMGNNE